MKRRRSQYLRLGLDRLNIFVPAIMSVGMAFWLVAVLRDVFRWRRDEALQRRAINAGRSTARMVRGDSTQPEPDHLGFRHRPAYLVASIALFALAGYVFLGTLFNYARDDGFFEGLGGLLAATTVISAGLLLLGAASLLIFAAWPEPPRWARSVQAWTPLSRLPVDLMGRGGEPGWALSAAAMLLPTACVVVGLVVATDWSPVGRFDEFVTESFEVTGELDYLNFLDPLGTTAIAIALAATIGIATLRCRPLALAYPIAVVVGLAITQITRSLVERPRPSSGDLAELSDSFPSGHVVQATLIAGLVPLALGALTGSRRVIWPARVVLGIGVIAGAIQRVDEDLHWPTDVIAGALIGLSLVVAVEWTLGHGAWHGKCRGCVWSPESSGPPLLGVVDLHISVQRLVRLIAHLWAAAAVVALTVLTLTIGLPTDPGEGALFGPDIQRPVQLGLALIVSVGALLSWKWEAPGAVLIALAGAGLGIFAALEYPPAVAFGVTAMLLLPALLLWLSWQHRRTMAEITALATFTVLLLGGTWVGVTRVHEFFFGPTHPESTAVLPPVDDVEWVWLGAVTSEGITVTAGLEDGEEVALIVEPERGGEPLRLEIEDVGDSPTVRFEVAALDADTEYVYRIDVDGEVDDSRGRGHFRTAPEGAASFSFVAGSCARTDSNGAVFDSMASADPLFYLNLGDIHYGNISSDDPSAYRAAYERFLTKPAQAEIYNEIPTAYVWDDHDYGPNDSDASSAGRDAARQAYREIVPHYDLAEGVEGAIYQAFTIGRVRFVLTDNRSERTDGSMLGETQKEWLIKELTTSARTHGLVIWGNPVPWIGEPMVGGDAWSGYPDERREIADALAAGGVENLVMISGDAHMVALDDGTNSDYSTGGVGGFPVLHAAALDRPGTSKGGPYSHGSFPGGGQYGAVDIVDEGHKMEVTLSGHTWDGEVLVEETFTFAAG